MVSLPAQRLTAKFALEHAWIKTQQVVITPTLQTTRSGGSSNDSWVVQNMRSSDDRERESQKNNKLLDPSQVDVGGGMYS